MRPPGRSLARLTPKPGISTKSPRQVPDVDMDLMHEFIMRADDPRLTASERGYAKRKANEALRRILKRPI